MTTSAARPPHSKQSTDLVAVAEESARDHHTTAKEPYAPPKQKLVTRTENQCYQLHRRIVDH